MHVGRYKNEAKNCSPTGYEKELLEVASSVHSLIVFFFDTYIYRHTCTTKLTAFISYVFPPTMLNLSITSASTISQSFTFYKMALFFQSYQTEHSSEIHINQPAPFLQYTPVHRSRFSKPHLIRTNTVPMLSMRMFSVSFTRFHLITYWTK